MTAYGLIQTPASRGASNESATRGSRLMFLSLTLSRMWVLTRSSPSSPIQMTVTWGLPSGLMVLRCAIGPASMSWQSSGGSAGMALAECLFGVRWRLSASPDGARSEPLEAPPVAGVHGISVQEVGGDQ